MVVHGLSWIDMDGMGWGGVRWPAEARRGDLGIAMCRVL